MISSLSLWIFLNYILVHFIAISVGTACLAVTLIFSIDLPLIQPSLFEKVFSKLKLNCYARIIYDMLKLLCSINRTDFDVNIFPFRSKGVQGIKAGTQSIKAGTHSIQSGTQSI